MPYRPEIDGLRAIAVVAVILFHADIRHFRGGFAGVDVFFVISGYLITRLILAERAAGTFRLGSFFERRARRLLPSLFLVMAVSVPFAFALMLPDELRRFGESVLSVLAFVSNVYFLNAQNYFDQSAEMTPLLHAWSLSVEEQFYLLYPPLLLAAATLPRRRLAALLGLIALASFLVAQFGGLLQGGNWRWSAPPSWGFYLLPTRAWELMLGAIIAAERLDGDRRQAALSRLAREAASLLGTTLILVSFLAFNRNTPFPSAFTLVPTVGTALVIVFARPGTLAHKVLASPAFVLVGLMSYSLYLWHQPLLAFSRLYLIRGMEGPWLTGAIVASFVLAYLSWRFVEQPFRDRRAIAARRFLPVALASFGLVAASGLAAWSSGQNPAGNERILALTKRIDPSVGLHPGCISEGSFILKPECRTGASPRAIVWGDSFAMHSLAAVAAANPTLPLMQATMPVCGPLPGLAPILDIYREEWAQRCLAFNEAVMRHILADAGIRDVVLGIHIGTYISGGTLAFDGAETRRTTPDTIRATLRETIRRLGEAGRRVTLISSPPRSPFDVGRCLVAASWRGMGRGACDFSPGDHPQNASVVAFLRSLEAEGVRIIWLPELICPDGVCQAERSGVFLFRDKAHLSSEGARLLGATSTAFRLETR